jgi:hypothetical protein
MLSNSGLLELKEEWGSIFSATILDTQFIWRPLTRKEFKDISSMNIEDEDAEELICHTCILEPDYDFFMDTGCAGIPSALAELIMNTSCLDGDSIKSTLTAYRREMNKFESQMDLVIHEAFQNYTMEEIQTWPMVKSIARYAQAEWILKELRNVPLTTGEDEMPEELRPPDDYAG